ncbi:MAG: hypothetical protein WCJ71_03470 [Candidatus Omnitrophota bacterium]
MLKMGRCFLGFILIVLWPGFIILHAEDPLPAAGPSQSEAAPATEPATTGVDNAVQAAQEEVRDPFEVTEETETLASAPPVDPQAPAIPIPVLEGMGFGSKEGYAVMGGEIFFEGDTKNGIKLLEVRRREVDIIVNGGKVTLPLFPGEDLKKARDRADKKNDVEGSVADEGAIEGSSASDQLTGKPSSLS